MENRMLTKLFGAVDQMNMTWCNPMCFFSVTQPVCFVAAWEDFWRLPVKSEQKDITTEITEGTEKNTEKQQAESFQIPSHFSLFSSVPSVTQSINFFAAGEDFQAKTLNHGGHRDHRGKHRKPRSKQISNSLAFLSSPLCALGGLCGSTSSRLSSRPSRLRGFIRVVGNRPRCDLCGSIPLPRH
jgi:hypothetical protein